MEEEWVIDGYLISKLEDLFNKIQISPYKTAKAFLILNLLSMIYLLYRYSQLSELCTAVLLGTVSFVINYLYQKIKPIELLDNKGYSNLQRKDRMNFRVVLTLLTLGFLVYGNFALDRFSLIMSAIMSVFVVYEYLTCLTYNRNIIVNVSELFKYQRSKRRPF